MMALVYGVTFGGKFCKKWTKGRWGSCWKLVFLTEIEIEPNPCVIIRALRLWHPYSGELQLETGDEF
jgi:hypothetical protein